MATKKKKVTKEEITVVVDAPIDESQGVIQIDSEVIPRREPTALDLIFAEIEEIKPQLVGLKHKDREKFGQLHGRFLYLIAERDRIKGVTYG